VLGRQRVTRGPGAIAALLAMLPRMSLKMEPKVVGQPVPNVGAKRALPEGYQYIGHCGRKQQKRNLMHSVRKVTKILDSRPIDPSLIEVRELTQAAWVRVSAEVMNYPDPEWDRAHLVHTAMQAAEQMDCIWADAMNSLLDQFEAKARREAEARGEEPVAEA
jgi:hypothetical protein